MMHHQYLQLVKWKGSMFEKVYLHHVVPFLEYTYFIIIFSKLNVIYSWHGSILETDKSMHLHVTYNYTHQKLTEMYTNETEMKIQRLQLKSHQSHQF